MTTLQDPLPALSIPPKDVFTSSDLVGPDGDRGLIRRAVSNGTIVKVCHGVYARSYPEDPVARHLQLVRACLARPSHPGVVGGISAALVHGLAVGPWSLPARAMFIRTGTGGGSTGERDVSASRLPGSHVCCVDDLTVASVARTIVDLARRADPWHDDLTALVVADSALRQAGEPAALRQECETVLEDLRGCSGIVAARRVLREATHLSAGPGETASRVLLKRMGMPAPLLDIAYGNDTDGAAQPFRAPFSWPSLRLLGVVLDARGPEGGVPVGWSGERHSWEEGPRQWLRDQGWCVVEWSLKELRYPWTVSRRLIAVTGERGDAVQLDEIGAPRALAAWQAEPDEDIWDVPPPPWQYPPRDDWAGDGWARD